MSQYNRNSHQPNSAYGSNYPPSSSSSYQTEISNRGTSPTYSSSRLQPNAQTQRHSSPLPSYSAAVGSPTLYNPIPQGQNQLPSYSQATSASNQYKPKPGIVSFSSTRAPSFSSLTPPLSSQGSNSVTHGNVYPSSTLGTLPMQLSQMQLEQLRVQQAQQSQQQAAFFQRNQQEEEQLKRAQQDRQAQIYGERQRLQQEAEERIRRRSNMQRAEQEVQQRKHQEAEQMQQKRLQQAKYEAEQVKIRQEAEQKRLREETERAQQIIYQAQEEAKRIKEDSARQKEKEEEAFQRRVDERVAEIAKEQANKEKQSKSQLPGREVQSGYTFSHTELESGPVLGQGAFGVVCKARLHGKEVAVKKLLVQHMNEESMNEFKQEISIMSQLRHPNLLLFIGACLEPEHVSIITEYMPMGSMQDVLFEKKIPLTMNKRLAILKEIAMGMNWLHSLKPPFLHRDLKPGNVLMDKHLSVRISDFGLSSVKHLDDSGQKIEGPVGSPFYMAPEILLDKPYDSKADVYSFSIVIWEILSNQEPYEGEFESYEELVEGITMDEIRPVIPEWFPVGITALLNQCWSSDPDERPSFQQILAQSWFDHILIDYYLCHSPVATQFWKSNFMELSEVPFSDFMNRLCNYCSIPYQENMPAEAIWKSQVAKSSNVGLVIPIAEFASFLSTIKDGITQPRDFFTKIG